MKIALAQTPGLMNDVPGAYALMARKAAEAKANGAGLLVLPEMFLSGYNIGPAAALAQAVDAAGLEPARRIAQDHGIALVFGYPEKVGGAVANAAILIGPDGETLLNYRKSHLFGELDRAMFAEVGESFAVTQLAGLNIGLLICYDIEFPEPARLLALAGADVILVPTAQMEPYHQVAQYVIPARAYENQVYVAYANHSGAEAGLAYIGESSICGPNGAVLAMAGPGEETLYATVEPPHHAEVRRADPLIADRRPELYAKLTR